MISKKFYYLSFVFVLLLFLIIFLPLTFSSVPASQLKVTSEHPFLMDGKWIPASDLKVGEILKTADGKNARITGISFIPDKVEVYNLEASAYSNFVLGDGLIVHNSKRGCLNPLCGECIGCGDINLDMVKIIKLKMALNAFKIEYGGIDIPEGLSTLEAVKNYFKNFKNPDSCFFTYFLVDEPSLGIKFLVPTSLSSPHSEIVSKFYSKEVLGYLLSEGGLGRQLHVEGGIAGSIGSNGRFGVIIGATSAESAFSPSMETQTGTFILLLNDFETKTGGKAYLLVGGERARLSELLALEKGDYSKVAFQFLEPSKQRIIDLVRNPQPGKLPYLDAEIVLPSHEVLPVKLGFRSGSFSSDFDDGVKVLKIKLNAMNSGL